MLKTTQKLQKNLLMKFLKKISMKLFYFNKTYVISRYWNENFEMNLNEIYGESASSVNKAIFEPVWKCKSISSIKSNHFHVLTILNFQPYRSETIKYQPEIIGSGKRVGVGPFKFDEIVDSRSTVNIF